MLRDIIFVHVQLLYFVYIYTRVCLSAESNGKLQHLFITSKTATMVPKFAVKDLLLVRIL